MALLPAIHVSDFHFGSEADAANVWTFIEERRRPRGLGEAFQRLSRHYRQTTHSYELAMAAAKFIVERAADHRLVFASGDLACTGLEADLAVARDFLFAQPSALVSHAAPGLRPTVAAGDFDVIVVPGNHDRYANHLGGAGSTKFDAAFPDLWGDPNPGVRSHAFEVPGSTEVLGVVCADFTLPAGYGSFGPSPTRYGCGMVEQGTLDDLLAHTASLRADFPDVGVLWMLHFPPTTLGIVPWDMRLIGGDKVVRSIQQAGVELVLAGHLHRPLILASGGATLSCAGSATRYGEPVGNYIHLLEIEVTAGRAVLVSRDDYRFDHGVFAFRKI